MTIHLLRVRVDRSKRWLIWGAGQVYRAPKGQAREEAIAAFAELHGPVTDIVECPGLHRAATVRKRLGHCNSPR